MEEVFSRDKLLAQIEREIENMDADLLARLYAFISGMESSRADKPKGEENEN